MKKNNSTSFIIFAGIFVLCVFTYIAASSFLPNNKESKSYYAKIEKEMEAKVENIHIEDSILNITTSGNAAKYCVKSTKSTPDVNNICWKKLEDNYASINIYKFKKYYLWIMDSKNNISESYIIK